MVYPTIPIESSSRSQLEVPPVHQISSPNQLHQQQQMLYPAFGTIPSVYSQGNIPFQNQCNQFDPRHHHQPTNIALRTTQELRAMQKNTKWQTKVRGPKVKEYLGIQNNIQQQYVQSPMMLYDSSHLTASQSSLSPVYLSQSAYSQTPYLTEPFTQFTPSIISPTHQYYKPPEFQTFCLLPERPNSIGQYNQPIHQQSYYNVKSKFQLSTSTVCPTNNIDNENYLPLSTPSSSSLINDNSKKNNQINYDIDKKFNNTKNISDDESSNFNFTIEAEKMVSELCNTYEYDDKIQAKSLSIKQEIKNDNNYNEITENKQCDIDNTKYSDLIKKLMYWACNEADNILKNSSLMTTKETSLLNLLSATKIALEKSSTCLPIYSGDKIFYQDLINSLMRICNGWLLLDHYLNRQNLINEKYDKDMIDSFKLWETSSHNLIVNLVKTFIKINKNCHDKIDDNCTMSSSIPGDVSLYLNNGIFGNFTIGKTANISYQQIIKNPSRNIIYPSMQNYEQKYHWPPIVRDNKLKSKWTVTDGNSSNKINDSYSLKNILNNDIIHQRQHNIIIPQVVEPTSSTIDNSIPIFGNLNFDEKSEINVANRMTLLSKIETKKKDDTMEGETINLSAWFASMRNNKNLTNLETNTLYNNSWWQTNTNITTTKLHHHQHQSVEFKMDENKQIRTLKNMRTIQSAPWTANYIFNDGNIKSHDNPDNLQIYMKPGSYNVPKKKCLNNNKNDLSKNIYPPVDQSIDLKSNDEMSCLQTVKTSQSLNNLSEKINVSFTAGSSLTNPNDIAWKAACASAEYILGSLSINETTTNTKKIDDKTTNNDGKIDNYFASQWQYKNFNKTDGEVSSYEASDDDSDVFELSNDKKSNEDIQKSHVKTDSWLIKTLNASTIINNNNFNDKIVDNVKNISDDKLISSDKTFDNNGKVTYSETVRKIPSNTKLSTIKKILPEGTDESYHSISSFSSLDDSKIIKINESSTPKISNDKICKVKKNSKNYQNCDKGWSVWYTSKKKQNTLTIEGFVIEKLTNIHKTLWKLDSSKIFKYPSSNIKLTNGYSKVTIDHYRKIIKNPIFLDTIGYKLKNNVYRKMEHVLKDFRKVVNNSKIYYKNNKDVIEKIESMSRKLEELINQHFFDTNRVNNNNQEIIKSSTNQLKNCVNNNQTIVEEKKILTSNNRVSKSINCSKSQLTNVT